MGCRCRRILFSVAIRLYPLDTTCECLGVCNDRYLKNGLKRKVRSADYRKLVCSNLGKHGNSYINGEKSTKLSAILDSGGGGGGYLGQFLLGICRWPPRAHTPLKSISWPILNPILVTFEKM